jgi:hypothetical protein
MCKRLAVLTMLCALLMNATLSYARELNRSYDWTIKLSTEQVDRYFNYHNSTLRPVDKVDAHYYREDDEKSAVHYEKLWYHEGKSLGLERIAPLGVIQGETVRLRITHKNGKAEPGELKAAADVVMRMWLDSKLNQNAVVVVTMPGQSLQPIADELVRSHKLVIAPSVGVDQDSGNGSTTNLLLQSETDSRKIRMSYL